MVANGLGLTFRDLFMVAAGAVAGILIASIIWGARVQTLADALYWLSKPR